MATPSSLRTRIEAALSRAGLNAQTVLSAYAKAYETEELDLNQLTEMVSEDHGGQMADVFIHHYEGKPDSFAGDYLWRSLCKFGQLATMIRTEYENLNGLEHMDNGFTDVDALASVAASFLAPSMVAELVSEAKAALEHRDAMAFADRDISELEKAQLLDREIEFHDRGGMQWSDHFDNDREAACG